MQKIKERFFGHEAPSLKRMNVRLQLGSENKDFETQLRKLVLDEFRMSLPSQLKDVEIKMREVIFCSNRTDFDKLELVFNYSELRIVNQRICKVEISVDNVGVLEYCPVHVRSSKIENPQQYGYIGKGDLFMIAIFESKGNVKRLTGSMDFAIQKIYETAIESLKKFDIDIELEIDGRGNLRLKR